MIVFLVVSNFDLLLPASNQLGATFPSKGIPHIATANGPTETFPLKTSTSFTDEKGLKSLNHENATILYMYLSQI